MTKNIKTLMHDILPASNDWKIQLLSSWDQIMGNLKTKVHLEKIMNDTLILGVYDSCWMQELYLLSPMLIQQINNALDKPYIKQVRFKKTAQKKVSRLKEKKESNVIRPVQLNQHEQQALKTIQDDELRLALEKFLIRCYREK